MALLPDGGGRLMGARDVDRHIAGPGAAAPAYVVPVMSRTQGALFAGAVLVWLVALAFFLTWWLQPAHVGSIPMYVMCSTVLAWLTLMPAYFIFNVARAVRPNPAVTPPHGLRVAMVVTKAPSEPFAVVRKTLEAMLAQDFPHDTWIADEDPSEETLAWCKRNGVHVSSRKGVKAYHQSTWPRRTRCKEGNLAYFYDHYGYDRYDIVSQLDADHVPDPSYLTHIMRAFADPAVGYVSAPSICDSNGAESWSARGRLYAEGSFHGVIQSGYGASGASLCIGSHYAVRTVALKQAGGIGPELAEDHSTSLLIAAAGWKGRHAIDAMAHGDGPQTFADMVTQEFQWSRSLMMVLLQYSPVYIGRLSPFLRFQFIYCQIWYVLFAIVSVLMFAMPLVAILLDQVYANVTYVEFLIHFTPQSVTMLGIAWMLKRFGLSRPHDAKVLSWENMLFSHFARWPWVVWGLICAVRDHTTKSFVDFRVTPKGDGPKSLLPLKVIAPYSVLAAVSAAVVLSKPDLANAAGFYWFATLNSLIYAALVVVILVSHIRENRITIAPHIRRVALQAGLAGITVIAPVTAIEATGMQGLYALQLGAEPLRLVTVIHPAYGAGRGGETESIYAFDPAWNADRSGPAKNRPGDPAMLATAPAGKENQGAAVAWNTMPATDNTLQSLRVCRSDLMVALLDPRGPVETIRCYDDGLAGGFDLRSPSGGEWVVLEEAERRDSQLPAFASLFRIGIVHDRADMGAAACRLPQRGSGMHWGRV
jgi:cellulose synthase (UDP-forming)